ncbi:hypothetical protein [Polymorphospora rubra]|uniref:hypothetical protein n=1 Tax=Polymorphospora rubra TaxID=338584 RepID=UPI003408D0AE
MAIQVAAMFGRSTYWIGVWPQAAVAAQIPVIFTAPFLAAFAAFLGGRAQTRGTGEQMRVSPRSPWAAHAAALGSVLAYGIAVYLGGQAVAAAVSLGEPGIGWLWLGYTGLGLTVVLAAVGLGYLLGALYPSSWIGPVCAGLGFFILVNLLIERFDFYPLTAYMSETFVPTAYASRFIVAAALVVVAVVAAVLRNDPGRLSPSRIAVSAATMCLLLVGSFAVVSTPELMRARTPVDPDCTDTTPKLCVWPENHKYLGELTAMASRMARLAEAGIKVPTVSYEAGLRPGPSGFLIIEGSMWAVASHLSGEILMANQPDLTCDWTELSDTYRRASGEFAFWVEASIVGGGHRDFRGGNPDIDMDAIERVVNNDDETRQFVWAAQRLATMENESPCTK